MKPWTKQKEVLSALRNEHVRVGEREGLRGLYAAKAFRTGEPVASYFGNVYSRAEYIEFHETDLPFFEHVSEYAVEIPGTDGHLSVPRDRLGEPGAHLINHSCSPNARWGGFDRGRILVHAMRPIAEGEEVTIFYGWLGVKSVMEKRWHECRCKAPSCAGTIELRLEWIEETETTGGMYLSVDEIARRFLADIRNDVGNHEELLLLYPSAVKRFVGPGVEVKSAFDYDAFAERLVEGAKAALLLVGGNPYSSRRYGEIANGYRDRDAMTARRVGRA